MRSVLECGEFRHWGGRVFLAIVRGDHLKSGSLEGGGQWGTGWKLLYPGRPIGGDRTRRLEQTKMKEITNK